MQEIWIIRGFARVDECTHVEPQGAIPVIGNAGAVVGWLPDERRPQDEALSRIRDPILTREERSELFLSLDQAEKELLRECVQHGETSVLADALRSLASDDDDDPVELAEPGAAMQSLEDLTRLERATAAQFICKHLSIRSAALAPSLRSLISNITSKRESLLRRNMALATSIAGSRSRGIDWPLALMAAARGLVAAMDRFDINRGNQFSTYATWWIRQSVNRARQNHSEVLRLPVHAQDMLARYVKAERALWQERRPIASEVVRELGLPITMVAKIAEWRRPVREALVGSDWSALAESIADAGVASPLDGGLVDGYLPGVEDAFLRLCERAVRIKRELSKQRLRERRQIMRLRLGIGSRRHTLQEIGVKQKVTRERIRQVEKELMQRATKYVRLAKVNSETALWDWNFDDE
jgi:RNA polymerase primary sigma factor